MQDDFDGEKIAFLDVVNPNGSSGPSPGSKALLACACPIAGMHTPRQAAVAHPATQPACACHPLWWCRAPALGCLLRTSAAKAPCTPLVAGDLTQGPGGLKEGLVHRIRG